MKVNLQFNNLLESGRMSCNLLNPVGYLKYKNGVAASSLLGSQKKGRSVEVDFKYKNSELAKYPFES